VHCRVFGGLTLQCALGVAMAGCDWLVVFMAILIVDPADCTRLSGTNLSALSVCLQVRQQGQSSFGDLAHGDRANDPTEAVHRTFGPLNEGKV